VLRRRYAARVAWGVHGSFGATARVVGAPLSFARLEKRRAPRRHRERKNVAEPTWANKWLDAVRDGSTTMSQRRLATIRKHRGGLDAIRRIAKKKGVHLLLLKDEDGNARVAASNTPFKVIC
jgi:hypothetical protein